MSSLKETVHCHKEPGHEHNGLFATEAEVCEEVCAEVLACQILRIDLKLLCRGITFRRDSEGGAGGCGC